MSTRCNDIPAAIALLQERAKYDPDSKLVYSLAALEASVGRADEAVHDLATAAEAPDGTNALQSAAGRQPASAPSRAIRAFNNC